MNGRRGRQAVGEEEIEADNREDHLNPDFRRLEPAELLAAVEHHLQRTDAKRQAQEAEPGERHVAPRRCFAHEDPKACGGEDAERQIDEEHPPPRIRVREPAAERRTHDRTEHDAHAPDRHCRAALGGREDVEHHRLAQRHERRAEHTLQQPIGDHLLNRQRDAAQHRGDGEPCGANDEQLLAAEARRHPAERRGHDCGRDDVGSQHPVDLILCRRKRALHVGQGDVGDRRIERLHDRRHHDADGQQPLQCRRDRLVERRGGRLRVHLMTAVRAPRRVST